MWAIGQMATRSMPPTTMPPRITITHDHLSPYVTRSFTGEPAVRSPICRVFSTACLRVCCAQGLCPLADDPDRRYVLQLVGKRWSLSPGESRARSRL